MKDEYQNIIERFKVRDEIIDNILDKITNIEKYIGLTEEDGTEDNLLSKIEALLNRNSSLSPENWNDHVLNNVDLGNVYYITGNRFNADLGEDCLVLNSDDDIITKISSYRYTPTNSMSSYGNSVYYRKKADGFLFYWYAEGRTFGEGQGYMFNYSNTKLRNMCRYISKGMFSSYDRINFICTNPDKITGEGKLYRITSLGSNADSSPSSVFIRDLK